MAHTVFLPDDVYEKLVKIKEKYEKKTGVRISLSEMMRKIIKEYYEAVRDELEKE